MTPLSLVWPRLADDKIAVARALLTAAEVVAVEQEYPAVLARLDQEMRVVRWVAECEPDRPA